MNTVCMSLCVYTQSILSNQPQLQEGRWVLYHAIIECSIREYLLLCTGILYSLHYWYYCKVYSCCMLQHFLKWKFVFPLERFTTKIVPVNNLILQFSNNVKNLPSWYINACHDDKYHMARKFYMKLNFMVLRLVTEL